MGRYGLLTQRATGLACRPIDLSLYTTVGIGGRADGFFPCTQEECIRLVGFLQSERIPYTVLGRGSNVLPCDGDYGGVVVSTLDCRKIGRNGETVVAENGVSVGKLLCFSLQNALTGLEFLTGIPATVGGLVYMNGGTAEGRMSDVVQSVRLVQDGKVQILSASECAFAYKESVFMHRPACILSVSLCVKRGDRAQIKQAMSRTAYGRRRLPKGRSMGCIFRNPAGYSAGKLIEECGLMGAWTGGAQVSRRHANFIINEGATQADFCALIERIRREVYEKTGILLREEIRYMQRE